MATCGSTRVGWGEREGRVCVCVGAGTVAQSSLLFLQELVGEEE